MKRQDVYRAILVVQQNLTNIAQTIMSETTKFHLEVFQETKLLVNVVLVPIHQPLTPDEHKTLMENYTVKDTQFLVTNVMLLLKVLLVMKRVKLLIFLFKEELKSIEGLQPASRPCKGVTDFVSQHSDPLIQQERRVVDPAVFGDGSACIGKSRCRSDEEIEQVQIHRDIGSRMGHPSSRGSCRSMQLHASLLQTKIFNK